MAKLLSTIIDGFVKSKYFASGAFGSGWRIARTLGRWVFETDDIVVRGRMTVFELLIQKIRAVKGALGITQASGKIKEIREDDTNYYIQVEDETSFVANDIIKCQTFSSGQKNYWVIVSNVVNNEIVIPKSEFVNSSLPEVGDEMVQFGNTTDKTRQSAIYLHADEGGQPAIDVLFGINSKSFDGKTKIRVGGDIPGSDGYKGFYCENGMIKSVNTKGETMYMLRPDGSGVMAKGNISWDADGNGSIFNRSIYWDTGGFHFGSGIKLTWDNLDDTAKENLKGEPGKDGRDGLNGADGVNGTDGVSIVWKGSFPSHPANPRNGWAYRNTTDKKSYVYQDGAWYQMTIDGVDGANGTNGNDGLSIVWKGDLTTPPASPVKNWVYRDTDNGRVYIYNGTAWVLMVADGNDGTDGTNGDDGNSVYITYHDSETEPSKPTGDGTTGGWHTNSTASVVWMSQKVAVDASSGEWGDPINIKGKPGADANLLPWVEDWNNNKTEIGGEYVISPRMFSGTRGAGGKLTGVAFGRGVIEIDGVKKTGVFGVKDGNVTFSIDAETGDAFYGGTVLVEKDPNNFVKIYHDGPEDWGMKGVSKGESIFRLGSENKVGPFSVEKDKIYFQNKEISADILVSMILGGKTGFDLDVSWLEQPGLPLNEKTAMHVKLKTSRNGQAILAEAEAYKDSSYNYAIRTIGSVRVDDGYLLGVCVPSSYPVSPVADRTLPCKKH